MIAWHLLVEVPGEGHRPKVPLDRQHNGAPARWCTAYHQAAPRRPTFGTRKGARSVGNSRRYVVGFRRLETSSSSQRGEALPRPVASTTRSAALPVVSKACSADATRTPVTRCELSLRKPTTRVRSSSSTLGIDRIRWATTLSSSRRLIDSITKSRSSLTLHFPRWFQASSRPPSMTIAPESMSSWSDLERDAQEQRARAPEGREHAALAALLCAALIHARAYPYRSPPLARSVARGRVRRKGLLCCHQRLLR